MGKYYATMENQVEERRKLNGKWDDLACDRWV